MNAARSILRCTFVNLPLRYIAEDPGYLDLFIERGLQPELGVDAWSLDHLPPDWHEEVSRSFRERGLGCSMHLPFYDLQPGSQDVLILEATRKRLTQAVRLARTYAPAQLIAHIGYDRLLSRLDREGWEERSAHTWRTVLGAWPGHPPLFLENVFEDDPVWVAAYLSRLVDAGAGLCLDIGHWHSFGGGARRGNPQEWIELFGTVPLHLHLHDNHGTEDEHLGLGAGSIPLERLFEGIRRAGLRPTVTFEPHTREDLETTVEYLSTNPSLFAFLVEP